MGVYIDAVGNFKAAVTGDEIQLNRKYKSPITFRFRGVILQCLNDYPSYRDKSDSLYRRQLCVPMTQCFTGAERKYIKSDYIHRREVLEYVLFKVLNMNYDQLPEPKSCKIELEQSKEMNDPVLQYMNEFMGRFKWKLVPYPFLYDLYKEWYVRNYPGKSALSHNRFLREFKNNLPLFPEWTRHTDENGRDLEIRSKGLINDWEPLILKYDLKDWGEKRDNSWREVLTGQPKVRSKCRGIIRVEDYKNYDPNAEEDDAKNKENSPS